MTDELKVRIEMAADKHVIHVSALEYECPACGEGTLWGAAAADYTAGATQFYAEGYRAGLEAAAKVADEAEKLKWHTFVNSVGTPVRPTIMTAADIGIAIRALIQAEK